jgi:ESS family glutamate:Na+ symporter
MVFKNPLMTVFFTTVGLGATFSLLIKGGPKVALFLGVASLYIVFQNALGISIATIAGIDPLLGLIGGSVTLSGGHGNGAIYADLFINEYGMHTSVFELAMAAATLGLILGGLVGGPVSKRLIMKYNLKPDASFNEKLDDTITFDPDDSDLVTPRKMMETLFIILLCMFLGGMGFDA